VFRHDDRGAAVFRHDVTEALFNVVLNTYVFVSARHLLVAIVLGLVYFY
jgi:hypothetical protein